MTFHATWASLLLLSVLAGQVVAPAGDWAYDLAQGFRVVRGPTALGNAPILLFPRDQPDLPGVVSLAWATRETTRGGTTYVEELGAAGRSAALGWFVVRPDAQRPWRFASEAEWREGATRLLPAPLGPALTFAPPGEPLPLPRLMVEAVDVLAENEALVLGRSELSGWFLVDKARQQLRGFPDADALDAEVAARFPGWRDRLVPGHGGLKNPAHLAGLVTALLLPGWPLATVAMGRSAKRRAAR